MHPLGGFCPKVVDLDTGRYRTHRSSVSKDVARPTATCAAKPLEFERGHPESPIRRFAVDDYESLVDLDFKTSDEVSADLMLLWELIYPDQPVVA